MKCPNCQKENGPSNRFCIACGIPLPTSNPPTLPENEHPQGNTLLREVQMLREEVHHLGERLTALEQQQKVSSPSPQASPPPVIPPVRRTVPRIKAERREWEQILGGNWLARIGVVALIFGIAFFLKFAFDRNWLGPLSRVILGVSAGLVMVGGDIFWQKKYPALAQALGGGGVALLYLSIFAAFALYRLIPFYPATGLLLLISACSAILATRYNSMALAIIGIIGAFIAPLVLSGTGQRVSGGAQAGTGLPLLAYIIIVDLGVIALSSFRNWRWFTLLALLGSFISFGVWLGQFGDRAGFLLSEGSLTFIFLLFVGATMFYHVIWRRLPLAFDYALISLNAALYFMTSIEVLADNRFRDWTGAFTLFLALFYGGLAYLAFRRGGEGKGLGFFIRGVALVFLTLAIPIQIGDKAWTTIFWAAEGAVLMWLALSLKEGQFRGYSYAVFAVTVFRLIFFDSTVTLRGFTPIYNERFLAFIFAITAIYLTGYLFWRGKDSTTAELRPRWSGYPLFFTAANFFSLWLLSVEVWGYFGSRLVLIPSRLRLSPEAIALRSAQNLSLTILWMLYAAILLVIGIWRRWRTVRLWALALLVIPIVKVFIYDIQVLETIYRIVAFTGLGTILLVSAYLYQRYRKVIRGFLLK